MENFYYNKNNSDIYYIYISELLKKILNNNNNIVKNIYLLDENFKYINIDNSNNIIIRINYEHTLVKKGGRSCSYETPEGIIKDKNNNNYLVRINEYNELNNSNIIIDYSIPNIYNVKNSNIFNEFSEKHTYIYPSIIENIYFNKENRNIISLTTFINIEEPRRKTLLENIKKTNINHININNCFTKDGLNFLYKNTKILINIHQTDHHDTFEELRVLPALQCGVIIISEYSPLSELVPYNDYIIWCSYDDIIKKTIDVINKYDYYHNMIFKKEKNKRLEEFDNENYNNLLKKIKKQF